MSGGANPGFDPTVRLSGMWESGSGSFRGTGNASVRIGDSGMSSQPVIQPTTRLVEVRQNILKQNDMVARELRERFHQAGVFVVSLVSSPGSGKTAFLEK